jgi:ribosomal-protein-alanine N-acetyltransferase
MYKFLETPRLTLSPLQEEDWSFILELLNTEGWLRFIGDKGVRDKEGALVYIRNIQSSDASFFNVVRLKDTKESIGMVSLMKRDFLDSPDIGYALLPDFERKGYAFEAVKVYLDSLVLENKYSSITAFARSENAGSIRLMERLGFHFKNTFLRDGENCSLYALEI